MQEPLPKLPLLPRRLLVAVDGSGPSVRAVEYATALALATGATMQLLLAIDTAVLRRIPVQSGLGPSGDAPTTASEALLCADAGLQLERCQRLCERAGVPYTMRIETKPPLEAILEAESKADLLVIGSRGRAALESASVGSLSQRVVAEARIPVLVVH